MAMYPSDNEWKRGDLWTDNGEKYFIQKYEGYHEISSKIFGGFSARKYELEKVIAPRPFGLGEVE